MNLRDVAIAAPFALAFVAAIWWSGFQMGAYCEKANRGKADAEKIRELRRIAKGNCGAALIHWKVYEVKKENEERG